MRILVVVAHPDDEVLGCGGSIAKWSRKGDDVNILIMSEGITSRSEIRDIGLKDKDLQRLATSAKQAGKIVGASSVKLLGFPDNRMDSLELLDIIKAVEQEINVLKPQIIITHHNGDLNIDHRIVHDAVITACRPQPGQSVKRLLAFEVPSSTEWNQNRLFQPNWFEDISETIDIKLDALKVYESEMREWPHARSLINVRSLAMWRGSSVGCEAAEAFMLIREFS